MARQSSPTPSAMALAALQAAHDQALAVIADGLNACRGNRQATDLLLDVRLALQGGPK